MDTHLATLITRICEENTEESKMYTRSADAITADSGPLSNILELFDKEKDQQLRAKLMQGKKLCKSQLSKQTQIEALLQKQKKYESRYSKATIALTEDRGRYTEKSLEEFKDFRESMEDKRRKCNAELRSKQEEELHCRPSFIKKLQDLGKMYVEADATRIVEMSKEAKKYIGCLDVDRYTVEMLRENVMELSEVMDKTTMEDRLMTLLCAQWTFPEDFPVKETVAMETVADSDVPTETHEPVPGGISLSVPVSEKPPSTKKRRSGKSPRKTPSSPRETAVSPSPRTTEVEVLVENVMNSPPMPRKERYFRKPSKLTVRTDNRQNDQSPIEEIGQVSEDDGNKMTLKRKLTQEQVNFDVFSGDSGSDHSHNLNNNDTSKDVDLLEKQTPGLPKRNSFAWTDDPTSAVDVPMNQKENGIENVPQVGNNTNIVNLFMASKFKQQEPTHSPVRFIGADDDVAKQNKGPLVDELHFEAARELVQTDSESEDSQNYRQQNDGSVLNSQYVGDMTNIKVIGIDYFKAEKPNEISISPGMKLIQTCSQNSYGLAYGHTYKRFSNNKEGFYPVNCVEVYKKDKFYV